MWFSKSQNSIIQYLRNIHLINDKIFSLYPINSEVIYAKPYGEGHINITYLVKTKDKNKYLEGDQEIGIVFRLNPKERKEIGQLNTIAIPTTKGAIPLEQVAKIEYGSENNIIWRRNLLPTITVSGGVIEGMTGNDVTKQVYEQTAGIRAKLPAGVEIEIGGPLEESKKTLTKLVKPVPAMILFIVVLLMLQMLNLLQL